MSRPLRLAGYIAIGILAGLLIAGTAIWILTHTDWGMERARQFAVGWLDERVVPAVQDICLETATGNGKQRLDLAEVQVLEEPGE